MFNFFRKKSKIEVFFNRLTIEQKTSLLATIAFIGAIDGEIDAQNKESLYLLFFTKQLNIDEKSIKPYLKFQNISQLLAPLSKCSDKEKAGIIFILRGMANIDTEANEKEVIALDSISKYLNFDLEHYINSSDISEDLEETILLFKHIIFLNWDSDIEEGAGIINHLAHTKISDEKAKDAFIKLALSNSFAKVRTVSVIKDEIEYLDIDLSHENIIKFYKYLNGKILLRLSSNSK